MTDSKQKYETKKLELLTNNSLIFIMFVGLMLILGIYSGFVFQVYFGEAAELANNTAEYINENTSSSMFEVAKLMDWAAVGEAFGVVAAIAALYALAFIYMTLIVQQTELRETRDQMKYQQIENSLFQMFGILNEIVAGISLTNKRQRVSGNTVKTTYKDREAFQHAYEAFNYFVKEELKKKGFIEPDSEDEYGGILPSPEEIPCENLSGENNHIFGQAYDELWPRLRPQFGHYFRYLYRIIKVIDDSDLPDFHKIKLAKVVRAQLSDYELALLFYNIQSTVGEKFEALCYKYDLLDNLPKDLYLCPHHRQIMFDLRDQYLLRTKND